MVLITSGGNISWQYEIDPLVSKRKKIDGGTRRSKHCDLGFQDTLSFRMNSNIIGSLLYELSYVPQFVSSIVSCQETIHRNFSSHDLSVRAHEGHPDAERQLSGICPFFRSPFPEATKAIPCIQPIHF